MPDFTVGDLENKLTGIETEVRGFINRNDKATKELSARVLGVEQEVVSRRGMLGGGAGGESIGRKIVESDGFKALQRGGGRTSGTIPIGSFDVKTVLSGNLSGPEFLPTMAAPAQRRLVVRSLMPQIPTTANLVEYAHEDSATGLPDYQQPEGVAKSETSFVYSLQQAAVCTLAHFVAASRQVMDDSQSFSSYIDGRMMYLLQAKEETEILYGAGTTGKLKGLTLSATAGAGGGTNLIDAVGAAISSLASINVEPTGVIINSADWWLARQSKAVSSGVYLLGSPLDSQTPSLWGMQTVATPAMAAGHFLLGDFQSGCALFDRMNATIEISREHLDFFTKNLVAILAEERLALACFRGEKFVYGSFTSSMAAASKKAS